MATDAPVPLATTQDFMGSAFADLATNLQADELTQVMVEATRACEDVCGRRLVPFTKTETHDAVGIRPDEYGSSLNLPMDLPGTVGRSYAYALGSSDLVRHVWLDEYAPRYQDMWTYTLEAVTIIRSYGGSQTIALSSIIGPETDSGHVWFQIGTFLPVGSMVRVTYSGGYQTIPASLNRAGKAMAASIIIKELDPQLGTQHDPDLLRDEAIEFLDGFIRD